MTRTKTAPRLPSSALAAPEAPPENEQFADVPMDRNLLHPTRRKRGLPPANDDDDPADDEAAGGMIRAVWLGSGLFLVLFAFWVLDTLKDPIFGALVGGNLEVHQPPAKLFSVAVTLAIVLSLEYIAHERSRAAHISAPFEGNDDEGDYGRNRQDILDGGGTWTRMSVETLSSRAGSSSSSRNWEEDVGRGWSVAPTADTRVSSWIFSYIGIPYCVVFGLLAYFLQFNPPVALMNYVSPQQDASSPAAASFPPGSTFWYALGYILYASIESFGSLSVATFWSFTNSHLSLHDAERFYGPIIAIAQLGAFAGSSMVTAHLWSSITLMVLACLFIALHILLMRTYGRRFPPTSPTTSEDREEGPGPASDEPTWWAGIYLILKHNYVLLILGASCLYEISLTCLNYQMTLLGWIRFEQGGDHKKMSFKRFMGHYGQMVNILSFFLSLVGFPWLMRRAGLRYSLRLFPSFLLLVNILVFGALPANLWVLVLSLSILKAMTYSIHDPAKEILYIPTSNAIKFKSKFWIDVVGDRVAKAMGSTINTMAGSVDRSVRLASAPSLLSSLALWIICFRVGAEFDRLIAKGTIVGLEDSANVKRVTDYQPVVESPDGPIGDVEDDSVSSTPSTELPEIRR